VLTLTKGVRIKYLQINKKLELYDGTISHVKIQQHVRCSGCRIAERPAVEGGDKVGQREVFDVSGSSFHHPALRLHFLLFRLCPPERDLPVCPLLYGPLSQRPYKRDLQDEKQ